MFFARLGIKLHINIEARMPISRQGINKIRWNHYMNRISECLSPDGETQSVGLSFY